MANCCHCNSQSVVHEYMQAFNIAVCGSCRRYEKTISKTNAKSTYLLSDADLSKLGCIEKQNPRHKEFAPMKMLLVSQVEKVAVAKYGSLAELQEAKQRRIRDKIDSRARKRAAAEAKEQQAQQAAQRVQAALEKHVGKLTNNHTLHEEEFIHSETSRKQQKLESELDGVEVEEF